MRQVIRFVVRMISNVASTRAISPTYGDVAAMHKGPCERCVGKSVEGARVWPERHASGGVSDGAGSPSVVSS